MTDDTDREPCGVCGTPVDLGDPAGFADGAPLCGPCLDALRAEDRRELARCVRDAAEAGWRLR
jgi:hypothetical protein